MEKAQAKKGKLAFAVAKSAEKVVGSKRAASKSTAKIVKENLIKEAQKVTKTAAEKKAGKVNALKAEKASVAKGKKREVKANSKNKTEDILKLQTKDGEKGFFLKLDDLEKLKSLLGSQMVKDIKKQATKKK